MPDKVVKINRAPVLTLWAAVVAERQGYSPDEALSLGKAVAALNAQAKGRRLGVYHEKPPEERPEEERPAPQGKTIKLLGRPVSVKETQEGLRAVIRGEPISSSSTERYLEHAFRENLPAVREAMAELAARFDPDELEEASFALYERFRPEVQSGSRGWGQRGDLDLDRIRRMK